LYRKPGADRLECFGDPAIRPYVERLMKHFGVIAWIMLIFCHLRQVLISYSFTVR